MTLKPQPFIPGEELKKLFLTRPDLKEVYDKHLDDTLAFYQVFKELLIRQVCEEQHLIPAQPRVLEIVEKEIALILPGGMYRE